MSEQAPRGWEVKKLGEAGSFSKGKGIAKKDIISSGIPCIRYAEIYTDYNIVIKKFKSFIAPVSAKNSKKMMRNDIIFAGSGETVEDIGKSVAYVDNEDAYVGGDAVVFSPTIQLGSVFLSYQLNDSIRRIQLRKLGQGSSVIHIYSSGLEELEVYLPPYQEQQKIASILTSVDEVIEKTEAQISKFQDLKRGMMQELLTKGIGHTEFKDSPVGRIPKGWNIAPLGEIGKWRGGGTPSKSNLSFWSGKIPWVSPKDMKSEFISTTEDKITESAVANSATNMIEKGSLLMVVRSGILKHTLPVAIAVCDLTVNQDMKAVTVNSRYSHLFVYHYLQANNHKVLRATLKAGNTVESIDFNAFSKYLIPYPPLDEQIKISGAVESIAVRIRRKQQLLKSYINLKKSLMQDLLTGKVRVNTKQGGVM